MFPLNLPNALTLLRILAVPVVVVALLGETPNGDALAAAVFALAALTDGLDGYFARSRDAVTTFGKLMDPLADKLLIIGALVSLVSLDRLEAWVAMVIIAREIAVTILRTIAAERGIVIAASWLGKAKTVLQIAAVIALIAANPAPAWVDLLVYVSPNRDRRQRRRLLLRTTPPRRGTAEGASGYEGKSSGLGTQRTERTGSWVTLFRRLLDRGPEPWEFDQLRDGLRERVTQLPYHPDSLRSRRLQPLAHRPVMGLVLAARQLGPQLAERAVALGDHVVAVDRLQVLLARHHERLVGQVGVAARRPGAPSPARSPRRSGAVRAP